METKFTPGPWYEGSTGNDQGLVIAEATGVNIAVAYDKRDAALIAAAPELLAACISAAESIEQLVKIGRIPANNAGLRDARAAIAKAVQP